MPANPVSSSPAFPSLAPATPEIAADPLLQPFRLKHLTLRNRFMSTSHACGLQEGGLPGKRYQDYHAEKARGGIALTMFGGSSNIAPDSPNIFQQLDFSTDAIIAPLQRFSERIHAHGAALMVQITHLGRRGESYADNWLPTIAPSAVRETLHRSFPRAMDRHDIARVVKAFGDAAWRCKQGGLDGLETLAGAHLIGQFLSPATNRRTDGYGGSLANRCRFGLEVYEEMRRRVGDEFILGFRFVVDEAMEDGLGFDSCVEAARIFERSGLVDVFNAVYGRMDTEFGLAFHNMPGMATPLGPWLDKAGAFRAEIGLPVFHAARIADLATARHAVREGLVDMVGMTRAHIADPHLVAKLAAGQADRIRPCVGATHCQSDKRPSCLHNVSTGREARYPHRIPRTDGKPRRVVVVGGGPAGLEAARIAGERGHLVTLFEAADRPGGQVRLAAQASWRRDIVGIIDWRMEELARLGVELRFNHLAEPADVLAAGPDAVILASGGVPDLDWLPGADHVTSAWDALTANPAETGPVIVYDATGRHPAPSCAERFALAGLEVELVALDDRLAPELAYGERVTWKKRLYELGVPVTPDQRLLRVEPEGNGLLAVFANEVTGALTARRAARIVVEHGTRPADELFEALRSRSGNDGVSDIAALIAAAPQPRAAGGGAGFELHRIGDAVASRNIHAAMLDAYRVCAAL